MTLDLHQAFHQVRVKEKDVPKTAFWGPDGLYEWVVIPFGFKNGPVFFKRIMDKTLRHVPAVARCYIDNIIIRSSIESSKAQGADLRKVNISEAEKAGHHNVMPRSYGVLVRMWPILDTWSNLQGTAPLNV
jgi:hypothetical protein